MLVYTDNNSTSVLLEYALYRNTLHRVVVNKCTHRFIKFMRAWCSWWHLMAYVFANHVGFESIPRSTMLVIPTYIHYMKVPHGIFKYHEYCSIYLTAEYGKQSCNIVILLQGISKILCMYSGAAGPGIWSYVHCWAAVPGSRGRWS